MQTPMNTAALVALAVLAAAASSVAQERVAQPRAVQERAVQERPRELTAKVSAATAAQMAGDPARAVAEFRAAMQRASAADVTPAVRTDVALNYAQAIQKWSSTAPADATCQGERGAREPCDALLTRLYRTAVSESVGPQRALARNNFGAWLLERKHYADALDVLSAIDLPEDRDRRAIYQYNQARALELAGRTPDALERYLALARSAPAFSPAADGAARVLRASPAPDAKLCSALVTTLLSSGQLDAADRATRRLLAGPVTGRWGAALLGLRLQYYVAARLPRAALLEAQPFLSSLAVDRTVRLEIEHVDRVLRDPALPLMHNPLEAMDRFPVPDMPEAVHPFAAFVKYAGDLFSDEGRYQEALPRYMLAWQIDPSQGESAVYAAALIRSHPEVDPRQLALNALLGDIFERKSAFIVQRDWPNTLRLHIVLGHIFEKLERWGPASDPRTALYQWKAAVADEERIRRDNRSLSPSPGLYESLALAYRRTGDQVNATGYFNRAEQAFRAIGRPADADRVARLAASGRMER